MHAIEVIREYRDDYDLDEHAMLLFLAEFVDAAKLADELDAFLADVVTADEDAW